MPDNPGRQGLQQRFFAWYYGRTQDSDYRHLTDDYKREIFAGLRGDILEIGPGTGDNLPFFAEDTHWIGVEPNLYMQAVLQQSLARVKLRGEIRTGTAEQTYMPDASVDAVISTFVLCSVTDLDAALAEILRVLRPGGRFAFLEHVGAPQGTTLRRAQRAIKPVWKLVADGCTPDRDTEAAIRRAGFAQVDVQAFHTPEYLFSPHIRGVAVKRES